MHQNIYVSPKGGARAFRSGGGSQGAKSQWLAFLYILYMSDYYYILYRYIYSIYILPVVVSSGKNLMSKAKSHVGETVTGGDFFLNKEENK